MTVHDPATCPGVPMCPECNQAACTEGFQSGGEAVPMTDVTCPHCGNSIAVGELVVPRRVTETIETPERPVEAMIDGQLSYDDKKDLVRRALRERIKTVGGFEYVWVYISDITDTAVVYAGMDDVLYQCDYTIGADNTVTLGDPVTVVRTYAPDPAVSADPVAELREQITSTSRVIEAKGTTKDGGRIFRVRIISYGDSKNRRRYPETVMRAAAELYEGEPAYDHHRTQEELATGTIAGLVGYYRSVAAESDGLYADLHLLPGATHAAEALDAALAGQDDGLEPLIGLSHDVYATFKPITEGGRQMQEATAITKVNSVDLVADPAAGGKASRVLAGGIDNDPGAEPESVEEDTVPAKKEDILAALKEASAEDLAAVGLAKVGETANPEPTKEPVKESEPVKATEAAQPKTGFLGKLLIKAKVEDAGLPAAAAEQITAALPDQITEAVVDAQIAAVKAGLAVVERAGLAPTVAKTQVTQEERDKKIAALDAFFSQNYSEGFHSFRQAFAEITGRHPRAFDEDFNRTILRESFGGGFDSGVRSSESLDAGSWAQVLGDSVTRRMMAMYNVPNLQSWRQIVSSIVPVNDFRTQRIGRIGGYGTLPIVNAGAPYQPLTSPGDEEATYAIDKRGGTEDLTLEMIANDDVRAISQIPNKLGRAAAQTLYRFVWDFLRTNAVCTYDGTALFHADHGNNITTSALSQSALSTARRRMREQTAYGDSKEILDNTPRHLIVPAALEEIAWTLATSVVSVGAAATDAELSRTAPNMHQGLNLIILSYLTDPSDWFLAADPANVPTLEVGFYQGRQDPELFTQADANAGSMFNADKMTLKIRHIYSGTILDHRGFYGGVGVA